MADSYTDTMTLAMPECKSRNELTGTITLEPDTLIG